MLSGFLDFVIEDVIIFNIYIELFSFILKMYLYIFQVSAMLLKKKKKKKKKKKNIDDFVNVLCWYFELAALWIIMDIMK